MKIERTQLLSILNAVKPGLAQKEIIEMMKHVVFTGEDIVTYNDRICIHYPFESDFSCSVRAEEFLKGVERLKGDEIEIIEEENSLVLKGKKGGMKLTTVVENEVGPLIEELKEEFESDEVKDLPQDLLDGISLCSFSAATDATTGTLTCVHIEGDHILCGDRNRASKYILDEPVETLFKIKARFVKDLTNFKLDSYLLADNWAHFIDSDSEVVFSTRLVKGKTPEYNKLFDAKEKPKAIIELPKQDILDAIDLVSVTANDLDRQIKFEIEQGRAIISASKSIGSSWQEVDIKYKGKGVSFLINPVFLSEALKKATKLKLYENTAILSSDKFEHIITIGV